MSVKTTHWTQGFALLSNLIYFLQEGKGRGHREQGLCRGKGGGGTGVRIKERGREEGGRRRTAEIKLSRDMDYIKDK